MKIFDGIFRKLPVSEPVRMNIQEWFESIVIALILAMIVRTFIVQAFSIPSGSMRPTLMERDRILANKFIYRFSDPQIGDVVIFRYPEDRKKYFVKRLIGRPHDRVEISGGAIYVNGVRLEEPAAIRNTFYYNKGPFGAEGQEIIVPAGNYFVLGDNSASSRDSRYWGFVPRHDIEGKAFCIYWPISRIGKVE